MMKTPTKAYSALDRFYQIGYDVLLEYRNEPDERRIDGLFISDCGILFSRRGDFNNDDNREKREFLKLLLNAIETISQRMINHYQSRIE